MSQEIPYLDKLMDLVEYQNQHDYPVRYRFLIIPGDDAQQMFIHALRKEGQECEKAESLVIHPNRDPLILWSQDGYIRIVDGGITKGTGVFRLTPSAKGPRNEDNAMPGKRTPKAFVSYSWDDDAHKQWVASLATRLRQDGVDVTLDQWHALPGDQLPEFMEREIRDNDFVLIMCTPNYRRRSDSRTGGVGYEGDIMTTEVFTRRNHRKFIPILCKDSWDNAAPSWLRAKYYVDLTRSANFERSYKDLLTTIHGTRPKAPPIGSPPALNTPQFTGQVSAPEPSNEPMRIDGIMVDEVTEPRLDGTRGSALYRVPFKLSRRASYEWARVFVQTWNRPPRFTSMHRRGIASVSGDRVILDGTTVEEIEKYHRDTLLLCLEVANKEEEQRLKREQQAEEASKKRSQQHRASVEDAARRLKFD